MLLLAEEELRFAQQHRRKSFPLHLGRTGIKRSTQRLPGLPGQAEPRTAGTRVGHIGTQDGGRQSWEELLGRVTEAGRAARGDEPVPEIQVEPRDSWGSRGFEASNVWTHFLERAPSLPIGPRPSSAAALGESPFLSDPRAPAFQRPGSARVRRPAPPPLLSQRPSKGRRPPPSVKRLVAGNRAEGEGRLETTLEDSVSYLARLCGPRSRPLIERTLRQAEEAALCS